MSLKMTGKKAAALMVKKETKPQRVTMKMLRDEAAKRGLTVRMHTNEYGFHWLEAAIDTQYDGRGQDAIAALYAKLQSLPVAAKKKGE